MRRANFEFCCFVIKKFPGFKKNVYEGTSAEFLFIKIRRKKIWKGKEERFRGPSRVEKMFLYKKLFMSTYGTCGLLIKYDPVTENKGMRLPKLYSMVLCKGSICWDQIFCCWGFFVWCVWYYWKKIIFFALVDELILFFFSFDLIDVIKK